jgi:hypothetical protein
MCEEVGSAPDPGEWTQRGTRFGTSPRFHAPPAADENGPPPVWTGERVAGLRVGGSTGTESTNVSIYSGYHRPRAASMVRRPTFPFVLAASQIVCSHYLSIDGTTESDRWCLRVTYYAPVLTTRRHPLPPSLSRTAAQQAV